MHEADAGIVRGRPVAERERLAVDPRLTVARVGLVVAGEDLDQRRLAGTVLADERVHFARGDVEADIVERDWPAKVFERCSMRSASAIIPQSGRETSKLLPVSIKYGFTLTRST